MKFLLALLLTITFGFLAGLILEWWSIALVAFLVAVLIPQHSWKSFLSGFFGIFILWALLATWIDMGNHSTLSHRVAGLLKMGGSSPLLILLTALIGGVVGGFAAMSGSFLRVPKKTVRRKKRQSVIHG